MFFCFKQKTAYVLRISDWSSDVCSSDLHAALNASLAVAIEWRDPSGELAAAIKGLRTIKSIEDAVAQVVANSKIAASAEAERHRANLAALDALGRAELFGETGSASWRGRG